MKDENISIIEKVFRIFLNEYFSESVLREESDYLKELLKQRSPRDTGKLETEGVESDLFISDDYRHIEISIPDSQLDYGNGKTISAEKLGGILNYGVGKTGKDLLRTQNKPKNPVRTPTRGYFDEFVEDAIDYLIRKRKTI